MPAIIRLDVINLAEVIGDLEYWCGPDGVELIVEKIQEKNWSQRPRKVPTEEEITLERNEIAKRIERLTKIQKESSEFPRIIYYLGDLYMGECPWTGNEYAKFFLFNDFLYGGVGPYTDQEFGLLCFQAFDKEREFFESLKRRFGGSENHKPDRTRLNIPKNVRIFVWQRDGGKCTKCGARERLEYDHIIPVSKGGGNTERNVELLCEVCNRLKGDLIV